jgi:hypothetical protein
LHRESLTSLLERGFSLEEIGRHPSTVSQALGEEVAKRVLLCSNCRAEVENGVRTLPVQLSRDRADHPI